MAGQSLSTIIGKLIRSKRSLVWRLGGISNTVSSLESLIVRGCNVVGIVMLLETTGGYGNVSTIRECSTMLPGKLRKLTYVLYSSAESMHSSFSPSVAL